MAEPTMSGEHLYATLLLSDSYLPGALVLGHSLRDSGTRKQLAVLVTLDSVSADAITQLKNVYDFVLPVPRIRNEHPANLYLMNRADLHSAFTKINLWKQTQFAKIVYIDADVIAYRAPDELFELPHAFSAAPDIGWPDLFNTGVMVLTPNMGDYYALLAMAERGISFDGADQGLLNMHFKHSFNRLSFTYNVTPSAHYQYVPAYRHFQSSINMAHFIGPDKPWFSGREASHGNSPFGEMVGRWWAVYDRHYRAQESSYQPHLKTSPQGSDVQPTAPQRQLAGEKPRVQITQPDFGPGPSENKQSLYQSSHDERRQDQPGKESHPAKPLEMNSWDAQRQPPPTGSKPEALNFPSTHYEMSRDTKPFVPPVRYPSPPKDMWYEVPKERPTASSQQPRAIFPWEAKQPAPSRSFNDPPVPQAVAEDNGEGARESAGAASEPSDLGSNSEAGVTGHGAASQSSDLASTTSSITNLNPWTSFSRLNAWDDVPEIGRYVQGLQRHRRTKSQEARLKLGQIVPALEESEMLRAPQSFKVTDFPTEVERPSLPVTPAPIRRPSFWGDDGDTQDATDEGQSLPLAEGVPSQTEWDPSTQLQRLAQQQSDALLRRLSGTEDTPGGGTGREIPLRSLPFGSDSLQSPTYVFHSSPPNVLSPRPIKGNTSAVGLVEDMGGSAELAGGDPESSGSSTVKSPNSGD